MTVLTMRNVSHTFEVGPDRVVALADINLEVAAGEFVAVMGPSGSGKSTVINVASGLVQPENGQVVVDTVDVTAVHRNLRAHLRRDVIGIVHQTDELDPVLTARENVGLPLRLGGARKLDAANAATVALRLCGAEILADRTRDQLSGGQRQRVALARAIVGDRKVVLADEPTAALDTVTARSLVETLAQLAHAGTAVLMTTHDSRLATYADRVVLLRDGRQVQATGAIELRDVEVST